MYKTEPYVLKPASKHLEEITPYHGSDGSVKLYIADSETLDTLIKRSQKRYKIVLFYTYWCSACRKSLPEILAFTAKYESHFDLFLVTGDRYDKLALNMYYLEAELNYSRPVFVLDQKRYGDKKNAFSRIDKFIEESCSICRPKKMGFAAHYVYNESNQILYYSGWEDELEQQLAKLKTLIEP